MGRHNRRASNGNGRPVSGQHGLQERVSGPSGDWIVRRVTGVNATKDYVCPGCNQAIRQGTPHVVAWPDGWSTGVDDRRHWHSPCWRSRERRR